MNEPDLNKSLKSVEAYPADPVKLIVGNNLAFAAPILAPAARS